MSPGDDAGSETEEGFVDVAAAFPADAQAFHVVVPGDGEFHDPPVCAQTGAVGLAAASDAWAMPTARTFLRYVSWS